MAFSFADLMAVLLIALLAGAVLMLAVVKLAWSPFTPLQTFFYWLVLLLTRLLWRVECTQQLPVPEGRGAVLVSNHRSSVDPFFFQAACKQPVHWMVAREFVDHPAFSWFLKTCEVIPAKRNGADTAATREAIRLAAEGGLVGMFPEGRINMTEKFMLPARPGAITIAIKAKALIVPCYIEGSPYHRTPWSPFFMPARVRLVFGEPVDAATYGGKATPQESRALALQCLADIAALAGADDHQPSLAGRNWRPTRQELEKDMADSERRAKRAKTT